MKLICCLFIFLGSILMSINIIKYSKSVMQVKNIHTNPRLRKLRTYYITLGLMCFFLLGYICTGVFIFCSSATTMSDFIIASVFLFGAVFVDIMIESQKNMTSLHAKEVLRTITDNVSTMICVVDDETQELLFVNQSMAKCLGKEIFDIVGNTCWKILHPEQTETCSFCPVHEMTAQKTPSNQPYYWEYESARAGKYFFVTSSYVTWVDSRKVQLHSFVDISERKKHERNLQICASTDRLTSAYNRAWGHQLLEGIFKSTPPQSLPVTICFLDLDGLKNVNDTYGHEAGDGLLCEFVSLINDNIRQQDMVIRWGGDEFVLLLYCNEVNAEKVMRKIRDAANVSNTGVTRPHPLVFSYGLEEIHDFKTTTLEKAVSNADQKMYEYKQNNKQ